MTSRKFSEMSFEKLTSYVRHKTFHMKSTSFHMKINNLKHCNIFSYEKKRIDMQEFSEISFLKSQNSFVKHKPFHMKINKFSYENQQLKKY